MHALSDTGSPADLRHLAGGIDLNDAGETTVALAYASAADGWQPHGGIILLLAGGGEAQITRRGLDALGWDGTRAGDVLWQLADDEKIIFCAPPDMPPAPVLLLRRSDLLRLQRLAIAMLAGPDLAVTVTAFVGWGRA